MRLATIESESKDGTLPVIHPDGRSLAPVPQAVAANLLGALEKWDSVEPELRAFEQRLAAGQNVGAVPLQSAKFKSPLPRGFAFLDGSAFLTHVERVRKSRGADMPPELKDVPLMYQGISDHSLDPDSELVIYDQAYGYDFEAELAVLLGDTPLGIKESDALPSIKLIVLLNDVSLRNLIPTELARGFGFLQGKPASSYAPFAVTPDELGKAWSKGRAALTLKITLNGISVGELDSGEMHFSFPKLIEHAARTRRLSAGTILGSGTVSNSDESRGIGCLVERRVIEIVKDGKAVTDYLKPGDEVRIEAFLGDRSVFGSIAHRCVRAP